MPLRPKSTRRSAELAVKAIVVVPTFRRPDGLADTLASLAAQVTATPFAVIVVENDADGRLGLAAAERWFETGTIDGMVVVEPGRGHAQAVNAGFAAALAHYPDAEFFLMIDDDERASPHWLDLMVAAAETAAADVVGGPVEPRFAGDAPRFLTGHPVFWPIDAKTGPLPMIYGSGNCLTRRRVFEALGSPAYDLQFNFLGGGDTDFFMRAKLAGFSSYWVREALVTETVPAARARVPWVLRRSLRIGAINRRLDRKRHAALRGAVLVGIKDLAILGLAPLRVIRDLIRTRNAFTALHPLVIAIGRLASACGWQVEQYRQAR
jgi:GT2 family glycosyltransferase